jgi:hypothetical protein
MALPKGFLVVTENGEEFVVVTSTSGQLELADGSPVNMIDENTFLIVATQQRATRRA